MLWLKVSTQRHSATWSCPAVGGLIRPDTGVRSMLRSTWKLLPHCS